MSGASRLRRRWSPVLTEHPLEPIDRPIKASPVGLRVQVGGAELILCAAKAAYDPIRRALLVADVHLGKALSFRALGVPVPAGTTALTLARLERLILDLNPKTVFVLGDLLHGPAVRDSGVIEQLMRWRGRHLQVQMVLVRGNHDDRAGDPPARCGIEVVAEGFTEGPWELRHQPNSQNRSNGYVLSGHVHPVYRLKGRADRVRLPAFLLRRQYAVLPAFGEFTGGFAVTTDRDDRVFVTDGEVVRAVPSRVAPEHGPLPAVVK
jgi:uncharacterized protein